MSKYYKSFGVPAVAGGGGSSSPKPVQKYYMGGGNIITMGSVYGDVLGLKSFNDVVTPVSEVPTLVPTTGIKQDGLSWCYLYGHEQTTSAIRWVASKAVVTSGDPPVSVNHYKFWLAIPQFCVFSEFEIIKLPVTGSSPVQYADVIIPWSV